MTDENPSCINHISVGTNDYGRAKAFYEKVLATLGCVKIMEFEEGAAFGKKFPEFWVQKPFNGDRATVGNGSHIGFFANSEAEVQAFYKAALEAGARDDGPPGPRPQYGEPYYGCFVRDLDGNKIEATFWDQEKAKKLGMMG